MYTCTSLSNAKLLVDTIIPRNHAGVHSGAPNATMVHSTLNIRTDSKTDRLRIMFQVQITQRKEWLCSIWKFWLPTYSYCYTRTLLCRILSRFVYRTLLRHFHSHERLKNHDIKRTYNAHNVGIRRNQTTQIMFLICNQRPHLYFLTVLSCSKHFIFIFILWWNVKNWLKFSCCNQRKNDFT